MPLHEIDESRIPWIRLPWQWAQRRGADESWGGAVTRVQRRQPRLDCLRTDTWSRSPAYPKCAWSWAQILSHHCQRIPPVLGCLWTGNWVVAIICKRIVLLLSFYWDLNKTVKLLVKGQLHLSTVKLWSNCYRMVRDISKKKNFNNYYILRLLTNFLHKASFFFSLCGNAIILLKH